MKNKSNEKIVNFLDKVASESIEPFINKSYEKLKEYTKAFKNKMIMKTNKKYVSNSKK